MIYASSVIVLVRVSAQANWEDNLFLPISVAHVASNLVNWKQKAISANVCVCGVAGLGRLGKWRRNAKPTFRNVSPYRSLLWKRIYKLCTTPRNDNIHNVSWWLHSVTPLHGYCFRISCGRDLSSHSVSDILVRCSGPSLCYPDGPPRVPGFSIAESLVYHTGPSSWSSEWAAETYAHLFNFRDSGL